MLVGANPSVEIVIPMLQVNTAEATVTLVKYNGDRLDLVANVDIVIS